MSCENAMAAYVDEMKKVAQEVSYWFLFIKNVKFKPVRDGPLAYRSASGLSVISLLKHI